MVCNKYGLPVFIDSERILVSGNYKSVSVIFIVVSLSFVQIFNIISSPVVSSSYEPVLNDKLEGNWTASWSFENPNNYTLINIELNNKNAMLKSVQVNFLEDTPSEFNSGTQENLIITDEIFIHEIAHLKRHDIFWNFLCRIIMSLFPFQPLLRFLAKKLELSSEYVCDVYVIAFGGDIRSYAHKLIDAAECFQPNLSTVSVGLGMLSGASLLERRIYRILDRSRKVIIKTNISAKVIILICGVVLLQITSILCFTPRNSQAASNHNTVQDEIKVTSIKKETGSSQLDIPIPVQESSHPQIKLVSVSQNRIVQPYNNKLKEITLQALL